MPTCFVIMGFGEKTDLATGRKLDLDKTYKNIIKPAVTAAGYDCVRADEVLHSGVIDVPMYDMLLCADLVVADLSTSNLNAVFELGVRHALRPRSTIVIAEREFRNPFDVNHIVIRPYSHLGSDIGYDETMRLRRELQDLAVAVMAHTKVDSPVYTLLPDLEEPRRRVAAETAPRRPRSSESETISALLKIGFEAKAARDFERATAIFRQVHDQQVAPGPDGKARPAWPCVLRELALATFELATHETPTPGPGTERAARACAEAIELLRPLAPETTNDPETLTLWCLFHGYRAQLPAALDHNEFESHRSQFMNGIDVAGSGPDAGGNATQSPAVARPSVGDASDLEIAIEAAERAFAIKRDPRNGSNLAYLLTLRSSLSSGEERIADRVRAERVRRKVVDLATERLRTLGSEAIGASRESRSDSPLAVDKYWTAWSLAESLLALGDPRAPTIIREALETAPAEWMVYLAEQRLGKLREIFAEAACRSGVRSSLIGTPL